jgi:predicted ATP-grasp superfamily ATP-dependent carboligase
MIGRIRRALSKNERVHAVGGAPAVLIGLDSMQGLQAARILHRRGVAVIALARDPRHHACRTRVCQDIRFVDTRGSDLIGALMALGRSLPERAVLFPCEDENVSLVARHDEMLSQYFHIALPPADVVEMLMNKVKFYGYAQENELPIPATRFLRSREDLEEACGSLTFPVVLKPGSTTCAWESHSTVSAFKVASRDELLGLYEQHRPFTESLIAQEWIPGPDSNLYSCNCYFSQDGEPLVTFVSRKVRQWPPHVGKSSLGIECRADDVLSGTLTLLRSVEYRGLGYVEFKLHERTGEKFIVEPNVGRPTGRSAIAEAGGVELLYTMYCDLLGLALPGNRQQRYGKAKWMHERRDFQSAFYYWRRGELSVLDWARSWRGGPKALALFSVWDPGPFLSDCWRAGRMLLSQRGKMQVAGDLKDRSAGPEAGAGAKRSEVGT